MGSVIGSEKFCKLYTEEEADDYIEICIKLSQLRRTSPKEVPGTKCLTRAFRENFFRVENHTDFSSGVRQG